MEEPFISKEAREQRKARYLLGPNFLCKTILDGTDDVDTLSTFQEADTHLLLLGR